MFISFIIRVHCHRRVAQHGLRAGGCDLHIPAAVGDGIVDMPEMPRLFFMLHLRVGDGSLTYRTPVNDPGTFINIPFFIQTDKYFLNGLRAAFVHGKTLPVPVAGRTQFLQLIDDRPAVFFFPLPGPF